MADAGLPRHVRLHRKADFGHVFGQAKKSADRCFTVLYRPNGLTHARLGLAVSRRTARSAVARNRIKRVIRESFRQRQQRLRGLDIVIISRPDLRKQDNAALFASLAGHWSRLAQQCASCC